MPIQYGLHLNASVNMVSDRDCTQRDQIAGNLVAYTVKLRFTGLDINKWTARKV